MKPMFALIAWFSTLTPFLELSAASPARGESDIIQVIRVGDQAAVRSLL
jgi:hypothetical protein